MSYNHYNDYAYPDWHQRGHAGSGPPPRAYSPSVSSENSLDSREREIKRARDREKERVRGNYGKVSLFMGVILLVNGIFQLWKQKQNAGSKRDREIDDRHERRRRRDDEKRRYGEQQYQDWRERAAQPTLEAPYGYANGYDNGRGGQVRSIEAPPPGWRDSQTGTGDARDRGDRGDRGDRSGKDRRRRSDY